MCMAHFEPTQPTGKPQYKQKLDSESKHCLNLPQHKSKNNIMLPTHIVVKPVNVGFGETC